MTLTLYVSLIGKNLVFAGFSAPHSGLGHLIDSFIPYLINIDMIKPKQIITITTFIPSKTIQLF